MVWLARRARSLSILSSKSYALRSVSLRKLARTAAIERAMCDLSPTCRTTTTSEPFSACDMPQMRMCLMAPS